MKIKLSNFKINLEGPEDELQLTKNTQPAILTVSYSIFKVLKDEFNFDFNSFKYFAGHSLGEYSALVCSESLNFNDALYLFMKEERQCKKQCLLERKHDSSSRIKTNEIKDLLNQ